MKNSEVTLSVVICTYNGQDRLNRLLKSILHSKIMPTEVIVVDNASEDKTADVCLSFKEQMREKTVFIYQEESRKGLVYARIKGVGSASSDFVIFLDDDVLIEPNFFEMVFGLIDSLNYDYYGFKTLVSDSCVGEERAFIQRNRKVYAIGSQYEQSKTLEGLAETLWGVGLCVRRKSYLHVDSIFGKSLLTGRMGQMQLAGDDSELCYRLGLSGAKGYYSDEVSLIHDVDRKRLNDKYLYKTVKGFGLSAPTLLAYRIIGLKKGRLFSFFAINKAAFFLYFFAKYLSRKCFSHGKKTCLECLMLEYSLIRLFKVSSSEIFPDDKIAEGLFSR